MQQLPLFGKLPANYKLRHVQIPACRITALDETLKLVGHHGEVVQR